jgi:hypothetical protein
VVGSQGTTTMGDLGKAHMIHATMNNHQDEHQFIEINTSSMIVDQTFIFLIDPSAIESFISRVALKRIKVKEVEQDDFKYVEMASGAKHNVGGMIMGSSINLGYFVRNANLYVTILGCYDIVSDMDWLESHDGTLNSKRNS